MFNKTGWILVGLNLFMAVGSGLFFLVFERLDIVSWLVVNTCALAILFFAAGFYFKRSGLIGFSIPWLLFYGGGGLMVFKWGLEPALLIPQIGHLIMTATVIYSLVFIGLKGNWKYGLAGFAAGLLVLFIVFPWQQNYQRQHPEILKHLQFKEGYSPLDN